MWKIDRREITNKYKTTVKRAAAIINTAIAPIT